MAGEAEQEDGEAAGAVIMAILAAIAASKKRPRGRRGK